MRSPKADALSPAILARRGIGAEVLINTTGTDNAVVLVVDLSWQPRHAGPSTKLSWTHVVMLHMQLAWLSSVVQLLQHALVLPRGPLTPHGRAMEAPTD